jgi:hypothetical protein
MEIKGHGIGMGNSEDGRKNKLYRQEVLYYQGAIYMFAEDAKKLTYANL